MQTPLANYHSKSTKDGPSDMDLFNAFQQRVKDLTERLARRAPGGGSFDLLDEDKAVALPDIEKSNETCLETF